MKLNFSIIFIFAGMLVFTGCSNIGDSELNILGISEGEEDNIKICDAPYIKQNMGCCLDNNSNSVCDNDDFESNYNNMGENDNLNGVSSENSLILNSTDVVARDIGVYFIGHSLVNTNMPYIFEYFYNDVNSENEVNVNYQIINGAPLRWNYDNSESGQGSDSHVELATGNYNVLILTEGLPIDSSYEWNDPSSYSIKFNELIPKSVLDNKLIIYGTWPTWEEDMSFSDWKKDLGYDYTYWNNIASDIEANDSNLNVELVSVGLALEDLGNRIEAGEVNGLTDLRTDFFQDDIHMNMVGNYYVAMIHYYNLNDREFVSLPSIVLYQHGGVLVELDGDLATYLQRHAWDFVSE